MNPLRLPALLLACSCAGAALAQDQAPGRAGATPWLENLSLSASANTTWVKNISRTSYAPTRESALTYDLGVNASRHQELAPSWLLHLGAAAEYYRVADYEQMCATKLGVSAGLQKKFGLGPLAPVLSCDAGYTYKAAEFSGDRGWTSEAGVRLAKRLDPALRVAVSGQWLRHDADSAVFDIQQRSWSVEAAWDISDHWRLTGSAGRLQGTIVANAVWSVWAQAIGGAFGPAVSTYYNSIPWGVTSLYGPGWVSYNVKADVDLWSLALACEVTERLTAELRTSSAFVVNQVGVRYPTESWGLGLNYRF
jgi:hypothetical protein